MAASIGTVIEDEQAFLDDVEAFMKQRGVHFERDGKVAGRPISLHRLYKAILELGGYDKVSSERLKWRELIGPFGLDQKHEPAMTFQLKTVYYKNLAAYEIARYWGETPPPPQILEDLTARGGDLRNRRPENYHQNSQTQAYDGGSDQHDEEEGQKTPVRNRQDAGIYVDNKETTGRQLRQDPKRTQIYQPDPTPERPRYPRATNSPQAVPPPAQQYAHAAMDPWNAHFSPDKYQPRGPIALSLQPLVTPGSHRSLFFQRKAITQAQSMPRIQHEPGYLDQLKATIPTPVLQGPNIYNRVVQGLSSGIEREESFALHHLVKVSDERGDKFTFAGFPGLAEALIDFCLEITKVVYGVQWDLSYDLPEGVAGPDQLNACFGTPQLRERIQSLQPILEEWVPEDPDIATRLDRIFEAALVLRNMLTLEANALFVSRFATFRDFLLIAINLPQRLPRLDEFRHYALEMAVCVTKYWPMQPVDPLYLSMAKELDGKDRGRILLALQAIFRIGVESEENFKLSGLPLSTVQRLIATLLLDDEELVEASLEVLYTFTAYRENVSTLLKQDPQLLTSIVPKLAHYLLHSAEPIQDRIQNRAVTAPKLIPPQIARVPQDLYRILLQYTEPDRASRWLRCCFEESAPDDITQIAIWQAYSGQFSGVPHIQAADFIKNISATFSTAQAQVISIPGAQPRFIIKGIRARRILVDTSGKGLFKCLWELARPNEYSVLAYDQYGTQRSVCGSWQSNRQNLWLHIMVEHLGLQRQADGKFTNSVDPTVLSEHKCKWLECCRSNSFSSLSHMSNHIRGHIPETEQAMVKMVTDLSTIPETILVGGRYVPIPTNRNAHQDELYTTHTNYHTDVDEKGRPSGIAFMAFAVMRNLARFVNRYGSTVEDQSSESSQDDGSHPLVANNDEKKNLSNDMEIKKELMARMFNTSVRSHLFYAMSVHRTLGAHICELLHMIENVDKLEKKTRQEESEEQTDDEMNDVETSSRDGESGMRMAIV